MKSLLSAIFLCFYASFSFAQTVERKAKEDASAFINRIMPAKAELAHPVIETGTWDTSTKSVIALYGFNNEDNNGYEKILGHLYANVGSDKYRDISFGPIEQDGGFPEIISVFFANADKDKEKELIVLVKLVQRHYDYEGDMYETYIFDNPASKSQLLYLEKLSEKFYGCECGWRDGRNEKAKFKTAKEVKAGLKKMGF